MISTIYLCLAAYHDVPGNSTLRYMISSLHFSKFKAFIHKWKIGAGEKDEDKTRWEQDYELIDNEGLFDEYLEMST